MDVTRRFSSYLVTFITCIFLASSYGIRRNHIDGPNHGSSSSGRNKNAVIEGSGEWPSSFEGSGADPDDEDGDVDDLNDTSESIEESKKTTTINLIPANPPSSYIHSSTKFSSSDEPHSSSTTTSLNLNREFTVGGGFNHRSQQQNNLAAKINTTSSSEFLDDDEDDDDDIDDEDDDSDGDDYDDDFFDEPEHIDSNVLPGNNLTSLTRPELSTISPKEMPITRGSELELQPRQIPPSKPTSTSDFAPLPPPTTTALISTFILTPSLVTPESHLVLKSRIHPTSVVSSSVTLPPFFDRIQPGVFAFMIGGSIILLLCIILCSTYVLYRMRKKDEGSYTCDETRQNQQQHYRRPSAQYAYHKASTREFYA